MIDSTCIKCISCVFCVVWGCCGGRLVCVFMFWRVIIVYSAVWSGAFRCIWGVEELRVWY